MNERTNPGFAKFNGYFTNSDSLFFQALKRFKIIFNQLYSPPSILIVSEVNLGA